MLMNFIAKLQQHYYDEQRQNLQKLKVQEAKVETVNNLIDFEDDAAKTQDDTKTESIEEAKEFRDFQPPTERFEFHEKLVCYLLRSIYKLAISFNENDRIKEYVIKTNFIQKSFIFMSNRIERFPLLFSILTNPENKVKEIISYLFLSGLKIRGHKIASEFIENLCIVLEDEMQVNPEITSP